MPRTRRRFLGQSAASCIAGCAGWPLGTNAAMNARIASIQTFPIVYPTVGRFKFFEGPRGQPSGRPSVLVKITADNGTIGWGQSVPYSPLELRDAGIGRFDRPAAPGSGADRPRSL